MIMALEIGDATAASGMTKAIYDQLNTLLSPPLQGLKPEDLQKVQDGWKQLAFAIAGGVVSHIKANMEIFGIQSSGTASVTVGGNPGSGTVTASQTGATTGHVK